MVAQLSLWSFACLASLPVGAIRNVIQSKRAECDVSEVQGERVEVLLRSATGWVQVGAQRPDISASQAARSSLVTPVGGR